MCTEEVIENKGFIKLSNIVEFLPRSKRRASFGKDIGNIIFYSSSNTTKLCNDADYDNECIILGTGGTAHVNYVNGKFSCSADNFIIKSQNDNIQTKYIYYYLKLNLKILEDGFKGSAIKHLSKEYLQNVQIPNIPIEQQTEIIKFMDKICEKYNINEIIQLCEGENIFNLILNKNYNKFEKLIKLKIKEFVTNKFYNKQ